MKTYIYILCFFSLFMSTAMAILSIKRCGHRRSTIIFIKSFLYIAIPIAALNTLQIKIFSYFVISVFIEESIKFFLKKSSKSPFEAQLLISSFGILEIIIIKIPIPIYNIETIAFIEKIRYLIHLQL